MKEIMWVKLYLDLYKNRKMKYLKSLPQGSAIAYIWVLLLLIGGESNADGCLMLNEEIPFTTKLLANVLDYPVGLMKKALSEYQQLNMITIEEGIIRISNWEKYQSTKKMAKIREDNNLVQQTKRTRAKIAKSS